MKYEYSVNGKTYTLPEEEVQAFLEHYPNAELIKEISDVPGKETGVAGEAATVAPDDVAAATGLESGTSLSESPRLSSIHKASLQDPTWASKDGIPNAELLQNMPKEYGEGRLTLPGEITEGYGSRLKNFEENWENEEWRKERSKLIDATGLDAREPTIDKKTSIAIGEIKLNKFLQNNSLTSDNLEGAYSNILGDTVENDTYLTKYRYQDIIRREMPAIDKQKQVISSKYDLNTYEGLEKANAEFTDFYNKHINNAILADPIVNKRIKQFTDGLDTVIQDRYTEEERERMGINNYSEFRETGEKAILGIRNNIRGMTMAMNSSDMKMMKRELGGLESRIASGELKPDDEILYQGKYYAHGKRGKSSLSTNIITGASTVKEARIIEKRNTMPATEAVEQYKESIKLAKAKIVDQNVKIKEEDLKIDFYKDYQKELQQADGLGEYVTTLMSNTANVVAEQAPQLLLALTGVGVFAQEYGDAYFDTIEAELDNLGIEMTDEILEKALLGEKITVDGKEYDFSETGDAGISTASAFTQQILETVGASTLANYMFKKGVATNAKSIIKLRLKEFIRQGGLTNLKQGVKKSAFTEFLTEGLQTTVEQLSKGAAAGDLSKYINIKPIVEASIQGGYAGALFVGGANISKRSVTEVQGLASRVASLKDEYTSVNIMDNMTRDINISLKQGKISTSEAEAKLDAIAAAETASSRLPKVIQGENRVKATELLAEKIEIENELENWDKDIDDTGRKFRIIQIMDEIAGIHEQSLEQRKTSIGKITTEGAKKIAEAEGVGFKEFDSTKETKSFIEKEKAKGNKDINITQSENYGFIIQNRKTGEQTIVLNKEEAKKDNVVTTAAHELLHGVLKNTFTSAEIQTKIGKELANEMNKMSLTGEVASDSNFGNRWNAYHSRVLGKLTEGKDVTAGEIGNAWEEGLNLLSEGLINGEIAYNETVLTKIGDMLRRALSQMGVQARFDTGRDVFNFVRDYNKSLVKGELTAGQQKVMAEGAGGALVDYAKSQEGVEEMGLRDTEVKPSAAQESRFFDDLTIEEMIGRHDFTFNRSDDISAFNRGRRQKEIIDTKVEELGGWTQELVNTWNKSAPKDMEMDYTEVKSSLKIPEISKENKEKAAKNKDLMAIIKDPILNETIEKADEESKEFKEAEKKIQDAKGNLYMNNVGLINAAVNEVFNPSKGQRVTREELVNDANKYFTELIKTFTPSKGEWGAYAKPLIKLKLNESITKQTESFKDKETGEWKMPSKEDVTEKQVEGKITTQPKFELEKEKVKKRLLTKKLDFDKEAIEGEFKVDKDGKKVPKTFADVFVDAVAKTFGTKLPAVTNKNFVKEFSKSNIAQLMPFVRSFTKIDRKNKIDKFKPFIIKHFKPILDQLPASVINKKYAMLRKPVLKETGQQKRESTAEGKGEFEYLGMDRKDFVDYFTNKNPDVIATVAGKITVKDINGDEKTYRIVKPKKGKPLGGNEIDGTLLVSKRLGDEITVNGQQVELTNIEIASNTLSDRRTSLLETIINELSADAALEVVKDKTIMQKFKDIQEIEGKTVPEDFLDRIVRELDRGLEWLNKQQQNNTLQFSLGVKEIAIAAGKLAINSIKVSLKAGDGIAKGLKVAVKAVQDAYGNREINPDIEKAIRNNVSRQKEGIKINDSGMQQALEIIMMEAQKDISTKLNIDDIQTILKNPKEIKKSVKFLEDSMQDIVKDLGPQAVDLLYKFGKNTFAHSPQGRLFVGKAGWDAWFNKTFPKFKPNKKEFNSDRPSSNKITPQLKKGTYNFEADKARANQAMQLYKSMFKVFVDKAKKNKGLNNQLGIMMTLLATPTQSVLRLAAPIKYSTNMKTLNEPLHLEHLTPSAFINSLMFEYYYNGNTKFDIEKVLKDYSVAIIPEGVKNILDEKGSSQKNQHPSYELGKKSPTVRIFNEDVKQLVQNTKYSGLVLLDTETGKPVNGFEINNKIIKKKQSELGTEFNQILEESKGIEAGKEYSEAQGRNIGRKANKLKIFVPYSAEDLLGLLYRFAGQGKQGDAHLKWIKDNISTPLTESFIRFEVAQQAANNYLKEAKNLAAESGIDFTKEAIDGYTVDQAIRIHIWSTSGYNLESLIGMSESQIERINKHVRQNYDIKAFESAIKDAYISNDRKYPPPKDNTWISGTITTDLLNFTNSITREEAFKPFYENIDSIFGTFDKNKGKLSGANLNKIKAIYGTNFVKALESSLYRIHTGRNRSYQLDQQGDSILNWTNNAIGNIMFFNTRSAVLQTLSNVNFTNWSDNNPIEVAKAWKNTGQFASDFTFLFNSDYLKSRRSGLKTDINEQEIATAVNSTNKVEAMLAAILKKGFLPTQMADSFAIALGGASFYRNRTNKYKNDGMSQKEAEEQAFKDFREISEESQQSSRPDKISMEQAGFAGRLILAFQNTPMQYNRLAKKAMLDLINGRGDTKTNVSKIIWYLGVQNAIFYASQQALFSILFDEPETDDEEKREKQRYFNLGNGMADSVLRGSGVYGALISTGKNLIIEVLKKGTKEEDVIKALTAISPPINSKIRKAYGISKKFIYKQELKKMKELGLDSKNPAIIAGAEALSFGINLPADRVLKKINNLRYAFEEETEWWQSVALALGWSPYDVNIDEFKKEPTIELKGMKAPRKIKKRTIKKRKIG